MRKRTRAKIGLIALVILGGELIALLVLLLAEPVSAAFAPRSSAGSNTGPDGAGTTHQNSTGSPGASHDRSPAPRAANFTRNHEYLLICYAVPTICETSGTGGWPNQYAQNFSSSGSGRGFPSSGGNNGQGWNGDGNGFSFGPSGGPGGSSPRDSEEPAEDGSSTQPDGNGDGGDISTEPFVPAPEDDNNNLLPNDLDNPPKTDSPEGDLVENIPGNDPPAPDFVDPNGPENPPTTTTPSEIMAVPEPMTLTLFGSGLAAIVAVRTRRRTK